MRANRFIPLALAATLTVGGAAGAQGLTSLELPPVLTPGGWARYVAWSSEGPAAVVIRVGEKGKHRGLAGTWLSVETRVPGAGLMRLELLIRSEGAHARVLKLRTHLPNGRTAERDGGSEPAAPKPRRLGTSQVEIGGRRLQVIRYLTTGGGETTWSPEVPGLGLVRVAGRMQLVAIGRGGDPWAGADATLDWPDDMPVPPPQDEDGSEGGR